MSEDVGASLRCFGRAACSGNRRCRWVGERVAVGVGDGVVVRSTVLAVIGRIAGCPGLIIHGTVETLWDAVLGENVGVEECL